MCGTSQTHYRCGRWICTSYHTRCTWSRKPEKYQYRITLSRIWHPAGSRCAFQSQSGWCSGTICGEGAHQSGKLCRPGTYFPETGIHWRRVCARNRKDTCTLRSFSKYLQGKPHRHPHRGKPRFSVRPHHVSLWRHPRRYGRIVHGIPAYLCCGTFQRCGYFHQGIQYRSNGQDGPSTGRGNGKGKYGFPASSGCYRSRGWRGRKNKILIRNRRTPCRWLGRYHSCLIERGSWKWNSGSPQTGWLYTNSGRTSFYSWKKSSAIQLPISGPPED